MIAGCYTALVTPFTEDNQIDYEGLNQLVDFQIQNGITGILAVGTTGESPTLTWNEHNSIIEKVAVKTKNKCICIAGTGSNNTQETLLATQHAIAVGADAVLLVDPYYNGPSSLEIRREYLEPVARAFPDTPIIPYIIPGRTGAQILPEDLAILCRQYENINTIKEATGNLENMQHTRTCCGPDLLILSGDDALVYPMMVDSRIKAGGSISVASNIIPKALTEWIHLLSEGSLAEADKRMAALEPLFKIVTIITQEDTPFGKVTCRARNPLAVKALMSILGMPSGKCRKPLGKMTRNGIEKVLEIARTVQKNHPEILQPIEEFFNLDIEARLNTPSIWEDLVYDHY
jgi:4-hydroxy-tetrahydrodipicolinate synthase